MPKHFNGTIFSTFFIPLPPVWPVFFALKLKEPVALTSLNSVETNRLNIDVEVQLAPNYDHAEFKNIPPSRNSSNQTCAKNIISTLRQNLSK